MKYDSKAIRKTVPMFFNFIYKQIKNHFVLFNLPRIPWEDVREVNNVNTRCSWSYFKYI